MSSLSSELFLTPDAAKIFKKFQRNRGLQLFPGIYSDDEDWLYTISTFVKEANSAFKVDIDDAGFAGPNALTSDFGRLLTVSGYLMSPHSYLPVDNELLRKTLNVWEPFTSKRHERIFDELQRVLFNEWTPVALSSTKYSSSGFPFHTYENAEKEGIFRTTVKNLPRIIKLMKGGDFEGAFKEFKFIIAFKAGTRFQADKPGKDRQVNDYEYAVSGGKRGKRFVASKKVIKQGMEIVGHYAMRVRLIMGMSACLNMVMQCFYAGWRKVYQNKYPFTFKHRGVDDFLAKISKWKYSLGTDVSHFDQSRPDKLINRHYDHIETLVDPDVVHLFRLGSHAPYFQPPVSPEQKAGVWVGNPFNPQDFKIKGGLMSGIANVSDEGKFNMVFEYLVRLDEVYHNVLEVGIPKILSGEHTEYAMVNMGDDCVLLFNDEWGYKQFESNVDNTEVPTGYFKVEKESGIKFTGVVAYKDARGETQACPAITSWLENNFVPERGIDSTFRKDGWFLGWEDRKNIFASCPLYSDVNGLFDDIYKHGMKNHASLDSLALRAKADAGGVYAQLDGLDFKSLEVLNDFQKLRWKYDEDEIDPRVVSMFYDQNSITAEEVTDIVRTYAGCPII